MTHVHKNICSMVACLGTVGISVFFQEKKGGNYRKRGLREYSSFFCVD